MVRKDVLIGDFIQADPYVLPILGGYGLNCLGCSEASKETLEEGCKRHGVDCDELIKALEQAL